MRHSHPFFTQALTAMAHRGFHGPGVTENTLPAFQRAVDLGYQYVESDLHVTKDDVVVLAHDPDLNRIAGRDIEIASITWPELSTIRLLHGERVPRLDEVLETYPEIHLNLDAKVPQAIAATAKVIERFKAMERVCIGSFSHTSVRTLRRVLPTVAHSASPLEVVAWKLGRRALGPHAFMVPPRSGVVNVVTQSSVARAHEMGASVHVWTVNDPVQMRELIALGVDGLMTDRADVLKEVLTSEGLWR
jgi:glycerophosphoryl diester phosphodiesterase